MNASPDPCWSERAPASGACEPPGAEDPRVVQALEEYSTALRAGHKLDRKALQARYPEIAEALSECLDGLEFLRAAAPQLQAAVQEQAASEVSLGTPLGDFRLLREVGRGGMGVVYEAEQLSLGRRVALKVLPFAAALDAKHLQRFKNEAQAAAHLHHPHIVPVHGVGCERGIHFYAMQFIDGHSLAEVIRALREGEAPAEPEGEAARQEPRLPVTTEAVAAFATERSTKGPAFFRSAAQLGVQAAEALDYAHRQGIIHRDIKPANLLLDGEPGRVSAGSVHLWIADFGLAKLQGHGTLTLSGDMVGTLRYMSPEQALAKHAQVDERTDLYSLGATLYELLTLEPTFPGEDREELLRQIALEEPKPPRRLNPAVPAELETVVLKALAKEPGERYATAQELADDLRRFLEDKPIRARRPTLWQRTRKWSRRHRPVVVAACVAGVLALVVAVASLAVSNVRIDRAFQAEQSAKEELAQTLYYRNIELANNAGPGTPRFDRLLAACPAYLRGWEWHYLDRLRYADPLTFPGGPDLAFSHDDRHLAAPHGKDVKVWDTDTGQLVLLCSGHTERVFRVAYSPDGTRLASAGEDQTIRLWDMTDGREANILHGHARRVIGLAYSPDGRLLASADAGRTIFLWDVVTGQEHFHIDGSGAEPQVADRTFVSIAFSPDGRHLAAGHANHVVRLWDVTTGQEALALRGHTAFVGGLTFSPDGRRLASASEDDTARVWDLPTGQEVFCVRQVVGRGVDAVFTPDGRRLAVTNRRDSLRVYDAATGQELSNVQGHTMPIFGVAASPDGRRLATVSGDTTAKVWDAASGLETITLRGSSVRTPEQVVFSHDGQRLATAVPTEGTVRVWDGRPGKPAAARHILVLGGHSDEVWGVAVSPDGLRLATASRDKNVKVWDARTGQELFTLTGHTDEVWGVAYSPDRQCLVSVSWDQSARVWDAETGRLVREFVGVTGQPWNVVFSPDGRHFAAKKDRMSVGVWDVATGEELLALSGHEDTVHCITYSGDGRYLATASRDTTVLIWDAGTGKRLHTLEHPQLVQSVAFSPDSRLLASGCPSDCVRLWDPVTGKEVFRLGERIPGTALSLAFSPDGSRLASAHGGVVLVWEVATRRQIETIRSRLYLVKSLAFSPDGLRLAAAGGHLGKGEVRVWPVKPLPSKSQEGPVDPNR